MLAVDHAGLRPVHALYTPILKGTREGRRRDEAAIATPLRHLFVHVERARVADCLGEPPHHAPLNEVHDRLRTLP